VFQPFFAHISSPVPFPMLDEHFSPSQQGQWGKTCHAPVSWDAGTSVVNTPTIKTVLPRKYY